MHLRGEPAFKRDANGDPDVPYYLATAHRLRAEATRDWTKRSAATVRRQLQQMIRALHLGGHEPSLHH